VTHISIVHHCTIARDTYVRSLEIVYDKSSCQVQHVDFPWFTNFFYQSIQGTPTFAYCLFDLTTLLVR